MILASSRSGGQTGREKKSDYFFPSPSSAKPEEHLCLAGGSTERRPTSETLEGHALIGRDSVEPRAKVRN